MKRERESEGETERKRPREIDGVGEKEIEKRYMTKPNINIFAELFLCDRLFGVCNVWKSFLITMNRDMKINMLLEIRNQYWKKFCSK